MMVKFALRLLCVPLDLHCSLLFFESIKRELLFSFVKKITTEAGELICAKGFKAYAKIKSCFGFLNKLQIEI